MFLRNGNACCPSCRAAAGGRNSAVVLGQGSLTWWNDDGRCVILDLDNETASSVDALPAIAGGASTTVIPMAGLEVQADEVVCMRLTDEGDLAYLAVGAPTQDLLELFKRDPARGMAPRAARAWRRALRADVRIFMSVLGDVGVAEFVQTVQFPLELVNTA